MYKLKYHEYGKSTNDLRDSRCCVLVGVRVASHMPLEQFHAFAPALESIAVRGYAAREVICRMIESVRKDQTKYREMAMSHKLG